MSDRMPVLFVSHGAPTLPFDDVPARRFLIELARKVPKPKAILCVSAHWEAAVPSLNAAPQPGTIHDFSGFPKALYELTYDAPGAPEVAERAAAFLRAAGSQNQDYRGMFMDGEVAMVFSGAESLVPLVDVAFLEGTVTWLQDRATLNRLLPPPGEYTRRLVRVGKDGL